MYGAGVARKEHLTAMLRMNSRELMQEMVLRLGRARGRPAKLECRTVAPAPRSARCVAEWLGVDCHWQATTRWARC
eukprot:5654566-Prymnesium_polylepis.1